ncbi:MAG: hypothetical protein EAY75_04430 [Bacteroidetes bacterium]|nr:MAG: hypothetical protein EAY75_04430 [Bacteroidota bacterium]
MENVLQNLRKSIFWDVELTASTLRKYPQFVIVRVFERGDISDIRLIRRFYGDAFIKKEIVKAKYIEPETFNYVSVIYNIPQKKFRCYLQTQ